MPQGRQNAEDRNLKFWNREAGTKRSKQSGGFGIGGDDDNI
jgi:hypothetical protein